MKTQMNKLFALSLLTLGFAAPSAMAADNYTLSCDSTTFEAPLTIDVRGGSASADASWDGPGSAIFEAKYHTLAVIDFNGETTITQPVVVGVKPGFHVVLRKSKSGKLVGTLHVEATDDSQMAFDGRISCSLSK